MLLQITINKMEKWVRQFAFTNPRSGNKGSGIENTVYTWDRYHLFDDTHDDKQEDEQWVLFEVMAPGA